MGYNDDRLFEPQDGEVTTGQLIAAAAAEVEVADNPEELAPTRGRVVRDASDWSRVLIGQGLADGWLDADELGGVGGGGDDSGNVLGGSANGDGSTAVGPGATANGANSTAVGPGGQAETDNEFHVGHDSMRFGATAGTIDSADIAEGEMVIEADEGLASFVLRYRAPSGMKHANISWSSDNTTT